MNGTVTTPVKPKEADETKAPPETKRRKGPRYVAPGEQKGTRDAKRTAAAILEVLAGARAPAQAAEALGVSANRYYQLESRALQGLVDACEPRPKGPGVSPEKELAKVRREADRLSKEAARYQALARVTQRAVGIRPPGPAKPGKDGKGRRRRRPAVRALKAVEGLKAHVEAAKPPSGAPLTAPAVK
jgi:hypothetical protein